jgi:hypothetical protein
MSNQRDAAKQRISQTIPFTSLGASALFIGGIAWIAGVLSPWSGRLAITGAVLFIVTTLYNSLNFLRMMTSPSRPETTTEAN